MALVLSRVELPDNVSTSTIVENLSARTGLPWVSRDETSTGAYGRKLTLSFRSLAWEVDVTENLRAKCYEVEWLPVRILGTSYRFWQVMATLLELGGRDVSWEGQHREVRLRGGFDRSGATFLGGFGFADDATPTRAAFEEAGSSSGRRL
jgi:hypothetical protein